MDFRYFSFVELNFDMKEMKSNVSKIQRFHVNLDMPEDPEIKVIISHHMGKIVEMEYNFSGYKFCVKDDLDRELDVVLGEMNTELDGRFTSVRSRETNLGKGLL
jgi:hypothetical protein